MPTIHEQIDELLAADLHGELSTAERDAFHAHLVDCADCRQAFQEEKNMHKVLNETFADKKADTGFEQRMVSRFRDRVPQRLGLMNLISYLMRVRAVQITGVAAVLLTLVTTGHWLSSPDILGNEELARPPDGSVEELRFQLAGVDMTRRPEEPPGYTDHDKPGANLDNGILSKTDTRGRGGDQSAASKSTSVAGMVAQNPAPPSAPKTEATSERTIVTHSTIPTEEAENALPAADVLSKKAPTASTTKKNEDKDEKTLGETKPESEETGGPTANRKLVRNATAELEVPSFEDAVQKITGFAAENKGYVSTSSSEKQENGKLSGQVVVKVLPDNLDKFLLKLRGIGELKNQALTTEDVTKQYFDTESRMKNARLMEQRLIEILKTKSKDVADLLEVEKELGRVREEIETMQGELKFMDSQVSFATVTIQLSEKNMNVPAAFLLKERAQLALYAPEVEKTYNDIKALASPKVQITNAQINRDNTGRVSGYVYMLIAPEESDAIIARVKALARVENFQVQTERVAQGGDGLGEDAKTERDKVVLNITISREEQEQALQQTTLRIRSSEVNEKTKELRTLAEKQSGRIRSSSFSRDANGRESANVSLRVPMKNYSALMQSLNALGQVEDVAVRRDDRPDAQGNQTDAPADVTIQVYSQGNIVSQETGMIATLRHTIGQGATALMWSARMIGVALAFLAPWVVSIIGVGWVMRRISRARRARKQRSEEQDGLS